MTHRHASLLTAGVATIALVTMGAAAPSSSTPQDTESPPRAITLSAEETQDHVERIGIIANDLDAAYLVDPNASVDTGAVVSPGDSPVEGAAALAAAASLAPTAEHAVKEEAEDQQEIQGAMAKARDQVVESNAEVTEVTAEVDETGMETVTAEVHYARTLVSGVVWQSVSPIVVTVDPNTGEYTSLDVIDDLPVDAGAGVGNGEAVPVPTGLTSTPAVNLNSSTQNANLLSIGAAGKERAAAYAVRWWNTRNPAYAAFPNDCANFVSQAMAAGGWAQIKDLATYRNGWPIAWFYSNPNYGAHGYSSSWAISESFYGQALWANSRVYNTRDRYALRRGDILQWKTPDNGGKMSHSTIVTGFTTEPLLTYHSWDNVNSPLSVVIAKLAQQYPSGGVLWYPLGVY